MSEEVKSFPLTPLGNPRPEDKEPVRRPMPASPKQ